jgi:hypothetical protein
MFSTAKCTHRLREKEDDSLFLSFYRWHVGR